MGVGDYGSPLVQNGLAMPPPHERVGYSSITPQTTVFGTSLTLTSLAAMSQRHLLAPTDTY